MIEDYFNKVRTAYSRLAETYNEEEHENKIAEWGRAIVRNYLLKILKKGSRILELSCGTGIDTIYFAKKGFEVHATDLADGMLTKLEEGVKKHKLENFVTSQRISATQLELVNEKPFDIIFSNFGGLNNVPDLKLITKKINTSILKPNGYIVWVIMPSICPWEIMMFPWSFKTAFRRIPSLFGQGAAASLKGIKFTKYYFNPFQVVKSFSKDFVKLDLRSLFLFVPPLYLNEFSVKHDKLFQILKKLDLRFSPYFPFNSIGDFFMISLQYRPKQIY